MLKLQLTSVFFVLLFTLSPIYGDFELLEFVSTWPATFFYANDFSRRPIPKNFTIHGLWPDNNSRVLYDCDVANKERYFTITDPKKITELDKRWPQLRFDYFFGIEKQYLWKHEFLKHGSCGLNHYKQTAYFDLAIKLKDKFDLLTILRNQGINPGSTYDLNVIERAIMTVSIKIPSLKCIEKPPGNVELSEIGICLDPEAKYMVSCPRTGSCHKLGPMIKFR